MIKLGCPYLYIKNKIKNFFCSDLANLFNLMDKHLLQSFIDI